MSCVNSAFGAREAAEAPRYKEESELVAQLAARAIRIVDQGTTMHLVVLIVEWALAKLRGGIAAAGLKVDTALLAVWRMAGGDGPLTPVPCFGGIRVRPVLGTPPGPPGRRPPDWDMVGSRWAAGPGNHLAEYLAWRWPGPFPVLCARHALLRRKTR